MAHPLIHIIAGTRPEAIKLAPVFRALQNQDSIDTCWISSGQHQHMLEQAQSVFNITPDVELGLMRPDQTPLDIVQSGSAALRTLWQKKKPAMVVVQGDTATAYAAALTAFYMRIPVAHVEAGLRSDCLHEPFPEEAHRRMIAATSTLHFAPTDNAAANLYREGIPEETIFSVGNTVVDALLSMPKTENFVPAEGVSPTRRWILVTAHRRENHGTRLRSICEALLDIRNAVDDVEIIFPVHLNPQVQGIASKVLGNQSRIHLLPPMDYFNFVQLMRRCHLILTDSGGVQEEAPSFKIPLLVLREQTERPEAIDAGMARLVGNNRETVAGAAIELLTNEIAYEGMRHGTSPFGDGNSGLTITKHILGYLGLAYQETKYAAG